MVSGLSVQPASNPNRDLIESTCTLSGLPSLDRTSKDDIPHVLNLSSDVLPVEQNITANLTADGLSGRAAIVMHRI